LMACLIAIDILWRPVSPLFRMSIPLAGLIVTIAVGKLCVVDRLKQSRDRLGLAWKLEETSPELEERLMSTIQFSREHTPYKASRQLIEQVAQQTRERMTNIDHRRLRDPGFVPSVFLAVSGFIAMLVTFGLFPSHFLCSFANVVMPWGARSVPRLQATVLPGDATIVEGDSVMIEANGNALLRPVLQVIKDKELASSHVMAVDPKSRKTSFILADLRQNTSYRVFDSGLSTRDFQITVLPKPVIERITGTLKFSESLNLPDQVINEVLEEIEAPPGTVVTLAALSTINAVKSHLTIDDKDVEPTQIKNEINDDATEFWSHQWELSVTMNLDTLLTVQLVSDTGAQSDPRRIRIRASAEPAPLLDPSLVNSQAGQLDQQLADVIEHLNTAESQTRDLISTTTDPSSDGTEGTDDRKTEIPETMLPDERNTRIESLLRQIDQAKHALENLTETTTPAESLQALVDDAKDVAKQEITQARTKANELTPQDEPGRLSQKAGDVKPILDQAIDRLDAVRTAVRERAKEMKLAARLDELAREQEQLAAEQNQQADGPEQNEDTHQELAKRDRQKKIADQVQDLVNQNLDAKSEQFKQRATEAEQLAKEATDLQRRQDQLAAAQDNKTNGNKGDDNKNNDKSREAKTREQTEIAKQTEQLKKKADELLKQPSEDSENQRLAKEAAQKLQQAEDDSKQADRLQKQQGENQQTPPGDPHNPSAPKGDKSQEQQKEQPQNADDQQKTQPAQPKQSEQKPADSQASHPEKRDQKAAQLQRQASKALKEAAESLQSFCKSCQKCANCNNPGGSGGSTEKTSQTNPSTRENPKENSSASRPSDKPSSNPGQRLQSEDKRNRNTDAQQLAKAADATNKAAQTPSAEAAKAAAQELGKLADDAAKKAGCPGRPSARKPNSPDLARLLDSKANPGQCKDCKNPGSNPAGSRAANTAQKRTSPGDKVEQFLLHGGSSSDWTRSGKKLKGNVLDDKQANIPEQYRNIVQDYFEQLSRIDAEQPDAQRSGKETPQ
jgi:hypothetical protein